MYKLLLADDEGIVTDSLRFIIEKKFPDKCEIEVAKTGRQVIEMAEVFRPDIAFMDIQMPGINGIEAMKELKKSNSSIVLIIMSAYDKFDYAREAINLNVLDYLNKPFNKEMIVDVLNRAMAKIDELREKRSNELLIMEKMESVIPMIESGFIYSILFQENYGNEADKYRTLLGIEKTQGYMMIIEARGENDKEDTGPVGAGIRISPQYERIRELIKGRLNCIVGPLLSNKIICFVSVKDDSQDLSESASFIEQAKKLTGDLSEKTGTEFRIGIGPARPLRSLYESYSLALEALSFSEGQVVHANDLPKGHRMSADPSKRTESTAEVAKRYIEENYVKDISLDDVAGYAEVSPYYLSRIFKEETGETFMEYLTSLRMKKAIELMKDPEYSIKDICSEVGYADPNYFSRIFKKSEGVTPTEYREKILLKETR
ncbi:MAG: helix-turn-helix domain-containing protein [Lachnospiraceae bacterium]|nr:helix-turn-helix domain-containing protein [Lachnospiraceae bacterium]